MFRNRIAATALAAGLVVGGAGGVILGLSQVSHADTPTTTPAGGTSTSPAASNAAPSSNEDATHEAGESAEREAAENNGTAGFGRHHGGSNEDAAHEASESPEREAAEDAAAPGSPQTTPAPASAAASSNA